MYTKNMSHIYMKILLQHDRNGTNFKYQLQKTLTFRRLKDHNNHQSYFLHLEKIANDLTT